MDGYAIVRFAFSFVRIAGNGYFLRKGGVLLL